MFQTLGAARKGAWRRLTEPIREPVQSLLARHCLTVSLVGLLLAVVCVLLTFVSKALPLVSELLALVGNLFSFVGRCFAVVGEPFTLLGEPFGLIGDLFPLRDRQFSLFVRLLTFEGQAPGAISATWRNRTGHNSNPSQGATIPIQMTADFTSPGVCRGSVPS